MGGGRRPALPPIAIRAGAGREGGRRGRLGPRRRQRARLPSAARACPGAGLGLAEARAGTWVRKLKPAARRWGGRLGVGVLICLQAQKYESCRLESFQKRMYRERPWGFRNTAGSLGRARGQTPGRRNAPRPGASGEACPINPALPGDAGGAGGGLQAGCRRPPPVGAGRSGGGGRKAGARSPSPCRLWVPRNFRTLPESFQSVKCLGEVGWVGGGARNGEALRWGRRPSGSCQFLEAGGLASDRNPSYLMIPLVERRLRGLSSL